MLMMVMIICLYKKLKKRDNTKTQLKICLYYIRKMSYPSEENIEDRIKSIIQNKLQESEFKDDVEKDIKKQELIEKLFEIFPDLKDQNKYFIDKKPSIVEDNDNDANEIVLDEFTLGEKVYYKDRSGGVWNNNAELVGITKKNDDITGIPLCVFFEKTYDLNTDINKIINS